MKNVNEGHEPSKDANGWRPQTEDANKGGK